MDEFKVQKHNGKLLAMLRVRLEKGHLNQLAVLAVVGDLAASEQTGADPWVVAFGANFLDPLPEDAPDQDPELSDWLLKRLERDIASIGAVFVVSTMTAAEKTSPFVTPSGFSTLMV